MTDDGARQHPNDPASAPAGADWSPEFLSRLVHELRTPLASLRIASDVLLEDAAAMASAKPVVAGLAAALADLDEILEPLSELNRIRAGRTRPASSPVALGTLGETVAAATGAALLAEGATLLVRTEAVAGAPSWRGDASLLARALTILVRSAGRGGAKRIDLVLGATPEGLLAEVRDDGTPPSASEAARFFEPFAAQGRARRVHGGTGLELPLAEAIAGLLGGTLTVRGEAPETVLSLRLPTR